MRNLIIALGCLLAVLLLAAPAQAYAIYNHVDRDMCVQTSLNVTFNTCKFTIPPNGKHDGKEVDRKGVSDCQCCTSQSSGR